MASSDATWHVYLLRCADDTLYCGVTTDLDRRLAQHNGRLAGGARYTRPRRPVALLLSRACTSRQEALRRSREVSADDVAAVAAELARAQRSRVTVGPSQ